MMMTNARFRMAVSYQPAGTFGSDRGLSCYSGTLGEAGAGCELGGRRRPRGGDRATVCSGRRISVRRAGGRAPAHGRAACGQPARRARRSARSFPGSVPPRLPHHSPVPRTVEPANLDLSHRGESGAQPASLLAPPSPRRSGIARPAHRGAWRLPLGRRVGTGSGARTERARPDAADRARSAAVRSADGDRAARNRRAELRRDRVFPRRGRGNGEVAPHTRAAGAGLGAAAATIVCIVIMLSMMRFATNERPDSLAAIVSVLAMPLECESGNDLSDASGCRARWEARFQRANESAEQDVVFALDAVVTQKGRLANLETLRARRHRATAAEQVEMIEGLLDAVSRSRFDGQTPRRSVTANVLWLFERATVRASKSPAADLQLPPNKKRAETATRATVRA